MKNIIIVVELGVVCVETFQQYVIRLCLHLVVADRSASLASVCKFTNAFPGTPSASFPRVAKVAPPILSG